MKIKAVIKNIFFYFTLDFQNILNTFTEQLTIKTEGNTYSSFTLTNTIGVTLMQQAITCAITNVDIRALPAGMYFVSMKGDNGSVVRKVVKE